MLEKSTVKTVCIYPSILLKKDVWWYYLASFIKDKLVSIQMVVKDT